MAGVQTINLSRPRAALIDASHTAAQDPTRLPPTRPTFLPISSSPNDSATLSATERRNGVSAADIALLSVGVAGARDAREPLEPLAMSNTAPAVLGLDPSLLPSFYKTGSATTNMPTTITTTIALSPLKRPNPSRSVVSSSSILPLHILKPAITPTTTPALTRSSSSTMPGTGATSSAPLADDEFDGIEELDEADFTNEELARERLVPSSTRTSRSTRSGHPFSSQVDLVDLSGPSSPLRPTPTAMKTRNRAVALESSPVRPSRGVSLEPGSKLPPRSRRRRHVVVSDEDSETERPSPAARSSRVKGKGKARAVNRDNTDDHKPKPDPVGLIEVDDDDQPEAEVDVDTDVDYDAIFGEIDIPDFSTFPSTQPQRPQRQPSTPLPPASPEITWIRRELPPALGGAAPRHLALAPKHTPAASSITGDLLLIPDLPERWQEFFTNHFRRGAEREYDGDGDGNGGQGLGGFAVASVVVRAPPRRGGGAGGGRQGGGRGGSGRGGRGFTRRWARGRGRGK